MSTLEATIFHMHRLRGTPEASEPVWGIYLKDADAWWRGIEGRALFRCERAVAESHADMLRLDGVSCAVRRIPEALIRREGR